MDYRITKDADPKHDYICTKQATVIRPMITVASDRTVFTFFPATVMLIERRVRLHFQISYTEG